MYRISGDEVNKSTEKYRKEYKPFRPFSLVMQEKVELANRYYNILTTQNGQDTDDYLIGDDNKVERYLSGYPRGTRLLLLGVGSGREILVAKELGFQVHGITFGSRNLDYAIDHLGLTPNEISECAVEILPFRKDTFDVIAGFQVFEHAISPLMFLLETGRVLRKGGILLLEWPELTEQFSGGKNPHHQICYVPGQAKALYEKAGFENIKLFYNDLSPIPEDLYWGPPKMKAHAISGVKGNPDPQFPFLSKAWDM